MLAWHVTDVLTASSPSPNVCHASATREALKRNSAGTAFAFATMRDNALARFGPFSMGGL